MNELARQLRWLIGIRLLVITSVVLSYGLLQIMPHSLVPEAAPVGPPPPELAPSQIPVAVDAGPVVSGRFLFILAIVTYVACLLYWWMLRRLRGQWVLQGHIQFFGDLVLISTLIWSFGEISNPFSLLYLVVIGGASVLLQRQAGFTIATVAYLMYAMVILGIYYGWLPDAERSEVVPGTVFLLSYNLGVHLFGFYAVAFLSYYLVHRVARVEQELEEKREDLADLQVIHRDVIQSINSGLVTTDATGTVTSINRAGLEILSPQRDPVGHPIYELDLFTPESWSELSRAANQQPGQLRSEQEIERGDERRVSVGFSLSKLVDAEGVQKGYIVIFQDFTRWRRLEEEVRIKDRMAAVGELAAGLAHEIGNPLAAISGSVQMLSRELEGTGEERKLLGILLKESQRLDRTIKGFLRFARPKERSIVHFDAAELLAENFELLKNSEEVSEKHHLELDLEPASVSIAADADQVSQIFWNLARNALKAMPEGGELRVTGRLSGRSFLFSVSDTGCGMTESQRSNLFHPFQSFFDDGTGIGMAIVYRIVEEHGGRLSVHSRPGEGTEIVVELPVLGSKGRTAEAPESQTAGARA